jgi:NitT/TauT family transport system ATP-binding protein
LSAFVEASDLGKVYSSRRGDITALQGINLSVRGGEFVSIVGPSGCGKSTLLKCVAGLEPITSGAIRVRGAEVRGPPDRLGVVFQRDVLLDWRTVIDNVLLPVQFRGGNRQEMLERGHYLLKLFDLGGFEHRYPWELSGGMRQRVAICRALLDDPELLLMDEPFGALDALTRDELNIELQNIWEATKKTVLFITHSISEAVFLSDRVAVMKTKPGKIVEIIDINLPRPRSFAMRETVEFGVFLRRIRLIFEELGVLKAKAPT